MTDSIAGNIQKVEEEVRRCARGRDVLIVAVSKTVPAERVKEAHAAGLSLFGENRIQEALPKIAQLSDLNITWHFIGHLQTNKVKDAVRHFSCIQSVDSLKLVRQIEKEAAKTEKKIEIFLEINLGSEESKYGLAESEIRPAVEEARNLQHVSLRGLMAIPPFFEDTEQVRPYFRRMRELTEQYELREVSMGMSHDFPIAIEEGSTMVRIGTAIFGERS
jgi:pyridoxal phosphate enzyme (YggS family)